MATSNLKELLEPFLTTQNVIVKPLASLLPLYFIYGLYTNVFVLCLQVILRRNGSATRLYSISILLLFVLATVHVIAVTFGLSKQSLLDFTALKRRDFESLLNYLRHDDSAWVSIANFSSSFMNIITDIMLVHRCYVIWDSPKALLYTLAAAAFATNGIILAGTIVVCYQLGPGNHSNRALYLAARQISMGCSIAMAVFNSLLSLLTAGRIWWISREARRHMGTSTHARYKVIVASILESGLLYPTTLIAAVVLPLAMSSDSLAQGTIPVDLTMVATLMSGLAPTLIIVRVAHGKSVDSVQQEMVSIQFAERETRHGSATTGRDFTLDTHSDPQLRDSSEIDTSEAELETKIREGRIV
ncbi:hypothetical protein PM082_002269 [Marasmius tenuissimus]|nr:hypothetical protein PM082_002269 [Marasmius tenuissimus]